jgi:hypothetical protein
VENLSNINDNDVANKRSNVTNNVCIIINNSEHNRDISNALKKNKNNYFQEEVSFDNKGKIINNNINTNDLSDINISTGEKDKRKINIEIQNIKMKLASNFSDNEMISEKGNILDNSEKFGIITYDVKTNLISSYYYNIKDYPILNNINNFTAYCNAKGFLYFSGGESEITNDLDKTSLKYNDFFSLDLTTLTNDKLEINELPNLNESRTWHSMIYVPNKYIFIVGGSNTKSVELYDIEEKKLTKDSELNEIRCECSLCLVNNMYLYAFFGFVLHQEYNNAIERCNLLKENRKWEYVNYEKSEGLDLKLSFFGISYFKDNELLLIGGNDNDSEKRYDYKYIISQNEEEKDIIKEFNCELTENNVVFRDKLFLPTGENSSINIPVFVGENVKIFILENGKINVLSHQNKN